MHVKLMVAGFTVLSAFALTASPFDDAKFWFRGGKPSHGNGTAVTGDFFDAAHASDPTHKNHTSGLSWGYEENRQFVTTDVTFPMTGETRQMQVLRLGNAIHDTTDGQKHWPVSVAMHNLRDNLVKDGVASDKYTIIMRLRRAGNPDVPGRTERILNWGYDGFGGFMIGFAGTEDGCTFKHDGKNIQVNGKYLNIWRGLNNGTEVKADGIDLKSDASLFVPTNVWVDVGLSVDGRTAQIVVVKPQAVRHPEVVAKEPWRPYFPIGFASFECDNVTRHFTGTSSSATFLRDCMFVLGADRSWNQYYSTELPATTSDSSFQGDVQQFAIWDRALSKEEMLDAFGEPRPQIVKVGLENGGSNEFGSTATGSRTINADAVYSECSANMAAGDAVTFSFTGRASEAGLRQIAKLTPASGSGRFSLAVNGVACGVEDLLAGEPVKWNVPGSALVSGANNAILTRVDAGATPFAFDSFTLGGSFQINDNATTEPFISAYDLRPDYLGGADVNARHWPSFFAVYELTQDVKIRLWVDEDVAQNSTSTFTVPLKMVSKDGSRGGDETIEFALVDSETRTVVHTEKADQESWPIGVSKNIVVDFGKNVLKPGWNTLNIKFNHPTKTTYDTRATVSYYRFETGKIHKGMLLIFR